MGGSYRTPSHGNWHQGLDTFKWLLVMGVSYWTPSHGNLNQRLDTSEWLLVMGGSCIGHLPITTCIKAWTPLNGYWLWEEGE